MTERIPIRLVAHSRDPLARAGLVALLARLPGVVVVDQVEDLAEAGEVRSADVIVSDFQPGDRSPWSIPGGHRLLALVTDRSQARQARAAGAMGTLGRDAEEPELAAAIRAVATGLAVSSFEFPRSRLDADEDLELEALTARETEALELIAAGLSNKAIAVRMGIRESTVKFHVNAVLAKLGAQSRTEAVTRALHAGLIRF